MGGGVRVQWVIDRMGGGFVVGEKPLNVPVPKALLTRSNKDKCKCLEGS